MPCVRFATAREPRRFTAISADTPDLVAQNGMLFEIDRNGGPPRPLMVDLRPGRQGQILGASNPNTVRQVLDHLSRVVGSLSGPSRNLVGMVLQRHGRNPNGGDARPGSPPLADAGTDAKDREGDHGQGIEGSARRPALDTSRLVDDAGRALPEVCRDLHAAVCDGTNREADRKADESRAIDVLRKFRAAAGVSFNSFVGAMQGILDTQPQRFAVFPDQAAKNTFASLMNFITSGKVKEIPSLSSIKGALGQVRDQLMTALDKMDFPDPSMKQVLKQKATQTRLRMIPDLSSLESIKEFVEGCGPDGMAASAFALPGTNEIMVCPGLLIAGAARPEELIDTLVHVAPHEWGHCLHVPNRKAFAKMEQCFLDNFRGFEPKQLEEAVADTIGASVLAERVRGKSASETLKVLRASTNILCFTSGKEPSGEPGEHPPGPFRINNLIGRNPDIMQALGCGQPTPERPACLMQGRVPAR